MWNSEQLKRPAKDFHGKIAMVVVEDGESPEEAWHRNLITHPGNATADVKIFHYPLQNFPNKVEGHQKILQFRVQEK